MAISINHSFYNDSQYFGACTLQMFGFFNSSACFWSEDSPAECRLGRSHKAQSVVYDSIAANMFGKLAAQYGKGSYYISALQTLGLYIPLQLRP
jgi:hypothetical protein